MTSAKSVHFCPSSVKWVHVFMKWGTKLLTAAGEQASLEGTMVGGEQTREEAEDVCRNQRAMGHLGTRCRDSPDLPETAQICQFRVGRGDHKSPNGFRRPGGRGEQYDNLRRDPSLTALLRSPPLQAQGMKRGIRLEAMAEAPPIRLHTAQHTGQEWASGQRPGMEGTL